MAVNEEDLFPYITKDTLEYELGGREYTPDYRLLVEHGVAENISEDPRVNKTQLNAFNRYYKIYPGDEVSGILNYIFIVRPDLNIDYCLKCNDPYFRNLFQQYPKVALSLTQSLGSELSQHVSPSNFPEHHFISWLLPRVTSYSVPDITLKTYDIEQPFTNYHTGYAGNANESKSGVTMDISFRDTRNYEVLKLFDAWVKYIDGCNLGKYSPKDKYVKSRITQGAVILDYAVSTYQIGVLAEAREIIYFHKTTGLFPTSVPLSIVSHTGQPSVDNIISVQFSGGLPEAFNPEILADFNYNSGVGRVSGVMMERNYNAPVVGAPFITWDKSKNKYYLRWSTL